MSCNQVDTSLAISSLVQTALGQPSCEGPIAQKAPNLTLSNGATHQGAAVRGTKYMAIRFFHAMQTLPT